MSIDKSAIEVRTGYARDSNEPKMSIHIGGNEVAFRLKGSPNEIIIKRKDIGEALWDIKTDKLDELKKRLSPEKFKEINQKIIEKMYSYRLAPDEENPIMKKYREESDEIISHFEAVMVSLATAFISEYEAHDHEKAAEFGNFIDSLVKKEK